MDEQKLTHSIYYYISSKAACDPCKTIYLCPPETQADTIEAAKDFSIRSGWQSLAEESQSILVVPVVPQGWSAQPKSLFLEIYKETCNQFKTRSNTAIWGRKGRLWCWETMLYVAAYEDGAVFAGNVLVEYPNFFAAAVLVNGMPNDYSKAESLSNHWLVPQVSTCYNRKNSDIPVHLWMFQKNGQQSDTVFHYFTGCYGQCSESEISLNGWNGKIAVSEENPAWQIRVLFGDFCWESPKLSQIILEQCFEHVIRWKNSPDGTLSLRDSKKEFYENPRFLRRTAVVNGYEYDYFIHLPEKKTKEQLQGLPLVFTVHGRGEPAWLFTTKNGWDRLADETGEFILVSPDSPGNIWFLPRDGMVFPEIVYKMEEEFGIDTSRIYLTGFSNGGMIVREVAISYPHLFAGVSPWNAPVGNTAAMMKEDSSIMDPKFDKKFILCLNTFLESGYEMPFVFIFGDRDRAACVEEDLMIEPLIAANDCISVESREENGCFTVVHKNSYGKPMVSVIIMRDMPHGAVYEESRFTWEFLKQFRRIGGARKVKEGLSEI
ncbi:MAG: hypothetical protein HFG68_00320 [Hungatella sp.]|nr:hypothetical protein [Hungatella sp.]